MWMHGTGNCCIGTTGCLFRASLYNGIHGERNGTENAQSNAYW